MSAFVVAGLLIHHAYGKNCERVIVFHLLVFMIRMAVRQMSDCGMEVKNSLVNLFAHVWLQTFLHQYETRFRILILAGEKIMYV